MARHGSGLRRAMVATAVLAAGVVGAVAASPGPPAAVVGAVAASPGPPAAVAAGSAQVLTEKSGYGPNEAIYASGAVTFTQGCKNPAVHQPAQGMDDVFQPWADIYVLVDGSRPEGSPIIDVNGAPNVVFGGLGGGFVDQVLGYTGPGGLIPAGTYDIVVDECQDGYFDALDTYVDDAFTVTIPLDARPAVFPQAGKQAAAAAAEGWADTAKAWSTLLKASSLAKYAGSAPVFAPTNLSIAVFTAGVGTRLPDPRPAAFAAMVQMARAQAGLAADPPDPAFQAHAGIDAGAAVGDPTSGSALEGQALATSRSVALDAALVAALVTAVERHQGAAEVGNGDWMAAHARDGLELLDLIEARRSVTPDLLRQVADTYLAQIATVSPSVRALIDGPRYYLGFGDLGNQERAASNRGVPADEVEAFMRDQDELAEGDPLFRGGNLRLDLTLDELATDTEARVDSLAGLRAQLQGALDAVTAEGRTSPRPTASAGGPYSAATDTPVALDATGSTGPVAIDAYAWDLDLDGAFDDATGPTPTFTLTTPGDRLVAVQVTDALGATDVAVAPVAVSVGDAAPVITETVPAPTALDTTPGATVSLSVTATDPEGQPLTIAWDRDGEPAGSGSSLTVTAPAAPGSVRYDAVVTDPAGNLTAQTFVVTANGPDADGDLWQAPGDCDDTRSTVNPSRSEVTGNGLDDDCDAITDDAAAAPRVGFIGLDGNAPGTVRYGTQEGDVIQLRVDWSHPLRYSGQEFAYDVAFSDGTTDSGTWRYTGPGTDNFVVRKIVRQADLVGARVCITAPGGLAACGQSTDILGGRVLPAPPVVHPADLTTWTPQIVQRPGVDLQVDTGDWVVAPGGYSGIEKDNQNYFRLVTSGFDLEATDEAPGRIAFDFGASAGDDDKLGFALGVQPDETETDAADWIEVSFWGHDQGDTTTLCDAPANQSISRPAPAAIVRHRGYGHYYEQAQGVTLAVPGAADPLCADAFGGQQLDLADLPAPLGRDGLGWWKTLVHPADLVSPSVTIDRLYHAEVTYSPSLLVVEVDGVEVLRAEAPPGDPFPIGEVALLSQSQPGTRLLGHTQVPTVEVTQGQVETFTAPFADADLAPTHTAVVEWGDGTPAAEATITPAGSGRWTLAADHAYARSGRYEATACVTDAADLQTGCGAIVVEVANAAPVVDAGPDSVAAADVTLDGVTYRDPGALDTHSGTVDWGDGSPVEPVALSGGAGGGLVSGAHTYTQGGTYTVEVCVTDDPGDAADPLTGCDSREVEVRAEPVAPEALVTDGPTVPEGTTVEIGVGFTDEVPEADHVVTVDWGDGTEPEDVTVQDGGRFGSGFVAHDYADDGAYTVAVTVCGADELCDEVETVVTVENVAPGVAATATTTGGRLDLTAVVADPGAQDTHTAVIDWGDGTAPEAVAVTGGPGGGTIAAAHDYTAPGTFAVEVCVTDDDGAEGCDGAVVTITEVAGPPITVTVDPLAPAAEGDAITLAGTVDDPSDRPLVVTVDPGDNTGPVLVVPAPDGRIELVHTYADDGAFTVAVEACSETARCGSATGAAAVANVAPSVDAGRDRATDGAVVLDDSTFADPGAADTHTATVDWGDGDGPQPAEVTRTANGGSVQGAHAYAGPGAYVLTVCVTDDDGGDGCETATVTVGDEPAPITVSVTEPAEAEEGSPTTLAFTATDEQGAPLEATIRWADGSDPTELAVASGSGSATHTFVDDGTYGVSVEACAADGRCGTGSATVAITNATPRIEDLDATVADGTASIAAAVADPGLLDTFVATIDWGDGTVDDVAVSGLREIGADHVYDAAGTYTVEVCATDDDGAAGCATVRIDVDAPANTAPILAVDPPDPGVEGSELVLAGTVDDADGGQTQLVTVDWGDGTANEVELAAAGPFTASHTYRDEGEHRVVVTTDDGTATDTVTVFGVTVTNAAPAITADVAVDGSTAVVTATVTDPGADDVLAATIAWGDGAVDDLVPDAARSSARFTGNHDYARPGTYEVTLCGADEDGGRTCATRALMIEADPTPPTQPPGSPSTTGPSTPTSPSPDRTDPRSVGAGPIPVGPSPGASTPEALSRTGTDLTPLVTGALALLAAGAATLLLVRRRLY